MKITHICTIVAAVLLVAFALASCGEDPVSTTGTETTVVTTDGTATSTTEATTEATTATTTTTVETTTEATTEATATTVETTTETTTEATTTDIINIIHGLDGTDYTVICDGEFDDENIVFQVGVVSDIHQNENGGGNNSVKLQNALKEIKNLAGGKLDGILCSGDITDNATLVQMNQFKTNYESVFNAVETPFVFCYGNHDAGGSGNASIANFQAWLGKDYFKTDVDTSMLKTGNRHCVINGFHVIAVMPQTFSSYGEAVFSEETLTWLDNTLAEITKANPNQMVFVLSHAMPYDTCYGSTLQTTTASGGLGWYTKDLVSVVGKYNQVMTLSGHLHFPTNDERSIMQTTFTAVGCASVRYMAIENGNYIDMSSATVMKDCNEYSQGLLLSVDKNGNTRIVKLDFYNGGFIKTAWVVPAPKADGSHLTVYGKDRANNSAPSFEGKTVKVEVNSKTSSSVVAKVVFDAASDDDLIHDYTLTVTNTRTNSVKATYNILADFYKHIDPADMKAVYEQPIKGSIKDNDVYKVVITARDSWGNSAEASCYFKCDVASGTITMVDGQ